MRQQSKRQATTTCALATFIVLLVAILLNTSQVSSRRAEEQTRRRSDKLSYVYWRNATKRNTGSVIPLPKEIIFKNDHDYLAINQARFELRNTLEVAGGCMIVDLAKSRYLGKYFFDDVSPESKDDALFDKRKRVGQLVRVELVGAEDFKCELVPNPDMDEAYNITLHQIGDTKEHNKYAYKLTSSSSWGLLRALETLSQLIFNVRLPETRSRGRGRARSKGEQFGIKLVEVRDEPRFKHRGFMLDTARHYISVEKIMELLDAMAFNKLNVFHWHFIDDQSSPYVSSTYPQLSEKGAYRPDLIYTQQDVLAIILYAATRGIRVVPELDTPGHTYTMRHIPENPLSECYDPATGELNGDFGPLDPTRPLAYESVSKLLAELSGVFHEPYFHAGGDEVDFDCWKSNKRIQRWMSRNNMTDNYEELSNFYMRKLYNLVKGQYNKTMIVWQEVFDMGANLPKDVVIHVWKNINDKAGYMAELKKVVNAGYPALLSSCWYLNYIDYGQDWIKFYQCDPRGEQTISEQAKQLILGGEICMWTEFVDDTNVVSRTWPRASAAAERLWSPMTANNTDEFLTRLEQHRCRLLGRGVQAEPVNGPGYC